MNKKAYYEALMSFFALIAVSMLLIEYTFTLSESVTNQFALIDSVILVVFTIDYVTRFIWAKNKKTYFKNNILELIAIIPFSSIFRIARIARLARVIKLTKLTRFARSMIFINKFKGQLSRFFKLNGLNYTLGITVLITLIGALSIMKFENLSFLDALWWSFVTITTVGYGDLSPESAFGRVIASILMLVGIGFIGMLTATIATFFIKPAGKSTKQETIGHIKRLLDVNELTKEDIEHICRLVKTLEDESK